MHKAHATPALPPQATVTVEVPRGAFVKRDAHGRVDLLSPVPSLFNYGRVDGVMGGDGEPQDAIVLGARLPRGRAVTFPVQGVIRFRDGPTADDKWICGPHPPSRAERVALTTFFRVYARLKRTRDRLARRPAESRYLGWQPVTST